MTSPSERGSHCSMQPACQPHARLSPSSIQRSPSHRSTIPTRTWSSGVGGRCSKSNLHAQRVARRRIELELVVIAEPVMPRPGCDRSRNCHGPCSLSDMSCAGVAFSDRADPAVSVCKLRPPLLASRLGTVRPSVGRPSPQSLDDKGAAVAKERPPIHVSDTHLDAETAACATNSPTAIDKIVGSPGQRQRP